MAFRKEEATINNIIQNIQQEYQANIDKFSKQIIISQIEGLLSYSDRFYNRQFITREKSNHQVLERLEKILADYFNTRRFDFKRFADSSIYCRKTKHIAKIFKQFIESY